MTFWGHGPDGPQNRGVATALKPVLAEQVRRPERSQVPGRVSVSVSLTLTEKKTGPVRSKKPTQAEQKRSESIHRQPRASTRLYTRFWPYIFQTHFSFFWPKRPGTRARTVVPLTTHLPQKSATVLTLEVKQEVDVEYFGDDDVDVDGIGRRSVDMT